MARKVIRCISHGPLSAGPHYLTPWEDVWLRWKPGKPSKPEMKAGPCLQCRAELVVDVEINRKCRQRWINQGDDPSEWDSDIANGERMLAELDANGITSSATGDKTPEIVTTANGINRREAERMLTWWLAREYGIKDPKFQWNKPEFVVMPMGVGDYS